MKKDTIIIDTRKYSEEEQAAFIEGWKDAGGYTDDLDLGTPCPWACAWHHTDYEIEAPKGTTPYQAGAIWWDFCKDTLAEVLAEEERQRDKEDDDE